MGGIAILHHAGNSAHFDYTSRIFKANRYSIPTASTCLQSWSCNQI